MASILETTGSEAMYSQIVSLNILICYENIQLS